MVYTAHMLTYEELKDRPRDFLAATGLTLAEFAELLPAYQTASATRYPAHLTAEGQARQRRAGGGSKGTLDCDEDRLLFILVYLKTNHLQTLHGLQFGLSQAQANYWIHRWLPVVQAALAALGMASARDGAQVATSPLAAEDTPDLAIDGTERRRQRPQAAEAQRAHYSGKKKTHTDKNIVLVNETTGKVVYLGPTEPGAKHDKKAADEAALAYPEQATLDKDTGFQGYEPAGVLTRQPKKTARPGTQPGRQVPQSHHRRCAHRSRARHRGHQALSHCQGCLTVDQRRHLRPTHGNRVRVAQSAHVLPSSLARLRLANPVASDLMPIMSSRQNAE